MVSMSNLLNGKDSRWLQLEVCREFQRNKCSRPDTECKFAHPPANVEVQNGRVTACYDSIKVSYFITSAPFLTMWWQISAICVKLDTTHEFITIYACNLISTILINFRVSSDFASALLWRRLIIPRWNLKLLTFPPPSSFHVVLTPAFWPKFACLQIGSASCRAGGRCRVYGRREVDENFIDFDCSTSSVSAVWRSH